ncbi:MULTISPECIES: hypothetical protein [Escherichia]|uniref:Uncharacterized protein n=1 Tax=Escherichia coli TaxID=562 RepID=A0AAW6VT34_ECOLX|nr:MULTISPECIES: hypothetical protein [Escherichia]MCA7153833.1 hypothetical protein [Escherichia coli]MCA7189181.1 hypothetical protein [Escherichia coli]MCA7600270.1 hypothetical protein [Escherichia coli]MCN6189960.1 hypothetical protein [Escherichia coli]MCV1260034.1 hypothetical protein [Escherichia coli]
MPYVEHRPFIIIQFFKCLGDVLDTQRTTNVLGYKPWLAIDNDGTDRVNRFKFEDGSLSISHGGYLHLVILITTATPITGGELDKVGVPA